MNVFIIKIIELLNIGGKPTIDSRTVCSGDIFFALKGNLLDGNDFIADALERGAAFVVTSKQYDHNQVIVVEDVIEFMSMIAVQKINSMRAKRIAITGSVGKTTLKEYLSTVLATSDKKVFCSKNSYNNKIGVPLSIMCASQDVDYIVLEVGTDGYGQIENLAKIIKPDITIITKIGFAHIGNFKSQKDLFLEKSTLIKYTKDFVLYSSDCPYYEWASELALCNNINIIGIGYRDCECVITKCNNTIQLKYNNNMFNYLIENCDYINTILSAFVAVVFIIENISLNNICNMPEISGRNCIKQYSIDGKNIKIIDSTYNSNPTSLRQMLIYLSNVGNGRKLAFLGDMFDLGKDAEKYHIDILATIDKYCIDKIYAVGKYMSKMFEYIGEKKRGYKYESADQIDTTVINDLEDGDVVLIKGSRGMMMERILLLFDSYIL